jgi:hypothetical protein
VSNIAHSVYVNYISFIVEDIFYSLNQPLLKIKITGTLFFSTRCRGSLK